ncbi:MAG: hypothetical protein IJ837_02590 [Clostridia bacterium]|nr:hypothetical protein [Clostridia bacterium]
MLTNKREELKKIVQEAEEQVKEIEKEEKLSQEEKARFIDFLVLKQLKIEEKQQNAEEPLELSEYEELILFNEVLYKEDLLKVREEEQKKNLRLSKKRADCVGYFLYIDGVFPLQLDAYKQKDIKSLPSFTLMHKDSFAVPGRIDLYHDSKNILQILHQDVECLKKFNLLESKELYISDKFSKNPKEEVVFDVRHLNGYVYAFAYFNSCIKTYYNENDRCHSAIFGAYFNEKNFEKINLEYFFDELKYEIQDVYLGKQTIADLTIKYPVYLRADNESFRNGEAYSKQIFHSYNKAGFGWMFKKYDSMIIYKKIPEFYKIYEKPGYRLWAITPKGCTRGLLTKDGKMFNPEAEETNNNKAKNYNDEINDEVHNNESNSFI